MKQNNLYVDWEGGPEYIDLNGLATTIKEYDGKQDFRGFTYDVRPDGKICEYRPLIDSPHFDQNGQLDAFSLKYDDEGTFRGGEKGDGDLGIAKYRFDNHHWLCGWRFTSGGEEGQSPSCELLDADTERTVLLAKQTLRNPKFRRMILEADHHKCVITEESQREALDAAHIHEVKLRGNGTIGNGITLRKDLHALFDARLFVITLKGRVEPMSGISSEYAELLRDKVLRPDTLMRIRSSLTKRNGLKKI